MRSSVSRWLSSPPALIASLLTVGLLVTLGVVACSDSVAPTASSENPASSSGESTTAGEPGASDEVHTSVEEQPSCGGVRALAEHIQYPESARKAGIEGRVFVQFVVDENGDVIDPKITKGVQEVLNREALRVVKQLECEPGKQRGKPVKVKMAVPVTFALPDSNATSSRSPTSPGAENTFNAPSGGPAGRDAAAPSEGPSDGFIIEKGGTQVARVLINVNGDLLVGDEPVDVSTLTDAIRRRVTDGVPHATLLYADGAPADHVAAAEARLRALDFQKVTVRKGE